MKPKPQMSPPPPRNTAARKAARNERRIIDLWLDRPKRDRTADHAEKFYAWLMQHEPDVIPSGSGSYQQLLTILKEHIADT